MQIQKIIFYIHPLYERDISHLSYLITLFRNFVKNSWNDRIAFQTSDEIKYEIQTLHIILYHPQFHQHFPLSRLPYLYLLLNVFDLHSHGFIHRQNILLASKAYRIADMKYVNLQFYRQELKEKTYYLPAIHHDEDEIISVVEETNDILFYHPITPRIALLQSRLEAILREEGISCQTYQKGEDELFFESKMIVSLLPFPNSYYDNLLLSRAVYYKKVILSEESPSDEYHKNYYFDKVLFEKIPTTPDYKNIDLRAFVDKIKVYLRDEERRSTLQKAMQKENYERNLRQFQHIIPL